MITPRFSCSQDDDTVTISVYVPSVRASEAEIHVEGTLFTIHINPYFLRLNFPSEVIEDDDSSAKYDPSSGYLVIQLTKEVKGLFFHDLDLLSKLLAPKSSAVAEKGTEGPPLIEVLGETETPSDIDEDYEDLITQTANLDLNLAKEREILLKAAENDWQLPQELEPEGTTNISFRIGRPYGFLDAYSGYFKHVTHSSNEVNELGGDAEHLSMAERRKRRIDHEEQKWDEDYYLADFVNPDDIQELIQWQSLHSAELQGNVEVVFTEEEKLVMLRLPRKGYLITPAQSSTLYLTLVSVLFAYAYDCRTTQHDPTSESAWTICSLTPSFSSLDTSSARSLAQTLGASYRRALAFPLYRNWALCERCRMDTSEILRGGRRTVTRVLLRLKGILDRHEVYYVYSKIWVDDFIVWVQSLTSDEHFVQLADQIQSVTITKESMGWSLDKLEQLAAEAQADSDDEDEAEVDASLRPSLIS